MVFRVQKLMTLILEGMVELRRSTYLRYGIQLSFLSGAYKVVHDNCRFYSPRISMQFEKNASLFAQKNSCILQFYVALHIHVSQTSNPSFFNDYYSAPFHLM